MIYCREFFALNLAFARRASQVSQLAAEYTLRNFTNLYVRFGLGHSLQPQNVIWQEYIAGLDACTDELEWTYQFALGHSTPAEKEPQQASFGCFSYSTWKPSKIRLHFHHAEEMDISPLSMDRMDTRIAELRKMFSHIMQHETGIQAVVGGSWLYNLEAYRRLFPAEFISSARRGEQDYPYLTLWGQFLDRHGQVRPAIARQFSDCIAKQNTVEGLLDCFPLKVFYLEAPLQVFYDYYAPG